MMDHAMLVTRAEKWLRGTMHCSAVVTECSAGETPDAIGWQYSGQSVLVECKASRADFLRDRAKLWRMVPDVGMGMLRYYMTPPGLVEIDELPEQWGLCEVYPRVVRVRHKASLFHYHGKHGSWHERRLLIHLLARCQQLSEGG